MASPLYIHKIYNRLKSFQNPFSNRYQVINDESNLSCIPFFIIGSGRSGNTLLRSILSGNSDISIPPESYRIPFAIKKFHIFNNRDWEDIVSQVLKEFEDCKEFYTWEIDITDAQKRLENIADSKRTLSNIFDELFCTYAEKHSPGSKIWGDKTPMNTLYLDWIGTVFPRSKFIHIIRDGRDVASSYLKMERYDTILEAANRWINSIESAQSFGSKIKENYIEIRYEELVTKPEEVIKDTCDFLDIDYDSKMLDHTKQVKKLGDTDKEHHSNLSKPISSDSVGKWRNNLSESDQESITKLLHKHLQRLGYAD
jgi:protein-tyrosine sulfotransferase